MLGFVTMQFVCARVATLVFAFGFDLVEFGFLQPVVVRIVYHCLCLATRLTNALVAAV